MSMAGYALPTKLAPTNSVPKMNSCLESGRSVGRIYENGRLYSDMQRYATRLEGEIDRRNRAQEALIESDGRFREMAENIRDVFFLVDADSDRFLYISPAYAEIWGRSCESAYATLIRGRRSSTPKIEHRPMSVISRQNWEGSRLRIPHRASGRFDSMDRGATSFRSAAMMAGLFGSQVSPRISPNENWLRTNCWNGTADSAICWAMSN